MSGSVGSGDLYVDHTKVETKPERDMEKQVLRQKISYGQVSVSIPKPTKLSIRGY